MSAAASAVSSSASAGQGASARSTRTSSGDAGGSETVSNAAESEGDESSVLGGAAAAGEGDKGGQGAQGDKAKAGKSDQAGELEIKLPEGVSIDAALLDGFKPLAKEVGLNSEGASKLVGWYAEQQAQAAKDVTETLKNQGQQWLKELKADKDFGGPKFAETAQHAQAALLKFGDPQLAKDIVAMGLDSHPGLSRMLARIGAAIKEDSSAGGGRAPAKGDAKAELIKLYPKSFNPDGTERR